MLYLQLPKEEAREAGERRPIALMPQVCLLWCALCRRDVRAWRARCTARGEVPVGRGWDLLGLQQMLREDTLEQVGGLCSGKRLPTLPETCTRALSQPVTTMHAAWVWTRCGSPACFPQDFAKC
eukprot:1499558-Amphidinium_carterae.1